MDPADLALRPGDRFAGHRIDSAAGRRTYRATLDGATVALRLGAAAPVAVELVRAARLVAR